MSTRHSCRHFAHRKPTRMTVISMLVAGMNGIP
jgi:hypothetical protein